MRALPIALALGLLAGAVHAAEQDHPVLTRYP